MSLIAVPLHHENLFTLTSDLSWFPGFFSTPKTKKVGKKKFMRKNLGNE